MKKMTNADLRRKIAELESQLVHSHHFAEATISKASGARSQAAQEEIAE